TRPAERIVLSEISGRDARSSNHSASPITPQLRAFTNSATRDFLLMRGTVIPGYVGAMFREGIREVVPAGAISPGDEIQKTGGRRMHRGLERAQPGTRDGPRRQARVLVGVPRAWVLQIGAMNGAGPAIFEDRRVHSSRIAVELHADAQPVVEHRRYQRLLVRPMCFMFHHRRQRDGAVNI